MYHSEALQNRIEDLRDRLSQASLRITADLDLDAVLQDTVDEARSLTNARYGVLAVLDDAGIFSEPRVGYRMAVGETREPSEPEAG